MPIKINNTQSIYNLVEKHPDIKEIMTTLGFKDIVKPGMLQSVGKFMTLKKGAKMKNIDWTVIEEKFSEQGYLLIEEESNE
ncbi:MAG: DUF1858 domain-containing protein [Clostridiales bacterium]|nr:DUF1858 domain-containing protein [Clostridiales bacterium]